MFLLHASYQSLTVYGSTLLVLTEVYRFTLEGLYLGSNLVRSWYSIRRREEEEMFIYVCLRPRYQYDTTVTVSPYSYTYPSRKVCCIAIVDWLKPTRTMFCLSKRYVYYVPQLSLLTGLQRTCYLFIKHNKYSSVYVFEFCGRLRL